MMTRTIILLFCLMSVSAYGQDSAYEILRTESLENIGKQSVLWVEFEDVNGGPCPDTVYISMDNDTVSARKNEHGKYVCTVPPGKHVMECSARYRQIVITDSIDFSAQTRVHIKVKFTHQVIELPGIEFNYDKPAIYLYPGEAAMDVKLKLDFKGSLGFTYPAYADGWNVRALPNGQLVHEGTTYDYLFWEGQGNGRPAVDWNRSQHVFSVDLVDYFESSLTYLGFNDAEKQDFICYWIPRMQKNEANLIYFLPQDIYEKMAPLQVTPKPDHVYRFFMVWRKAEAGELSSGTLPKPAHRSGFTLIEWGGMEMPNGSGL